MHKLEASGGKCGDWPRTQYFQRTLQSSAKEIAR